MGNFSCALCFKEELNTGLISYNCDVVEKPFGITSAPFLLESPVGKCLWMNEFEMFEYERSSPEDNIMAMEWNKTHLWKLINTHMWIKFCIVEIPVYERPTLWGPPGQPLRYIDRYGMK